MDKCFVTFSRFSTIIGRGSNKRCLKHTALVSLLIFESPELEQVFSTAGLETCVWVTSVAYCQGQWPDPCDVGGSTSKCLGNRAERVLGMSLGDYTRGCLCLALSSLPRAHNDREEMVAGVKPPDFLHRKMPPSLTSHSHCGERRGPQGS